MAGKMISNKNHENKSSKRYEYKDEDVFVIEDESNFTMENNNLPNGKGNAMEIGKGKMELARQQLSSPTSPFDMHPDDEEARNHRLESSTMTGKPGEHLELNTERDAI